LEGRRALRPLRRAPPPPSRSSPPSPPRLEYLLYRVWYGMVPPLSPLASSPPALRGSRRAAGKTTSRRGRGGTTDARGRRRMESAEVREGAERASDDTPPRDRFVGDQVSRRRRAKYSKDGVSCDGEGGPL
jgi:hypothetical protein